MLSRLFILIFSFTLLSSCEGVIRGKGKIISAHDNSSLDSVKISYFSTVVYSDKNGNFNIEEFGGCVPSCPDLEVLLTKRGYETKYVNLTKESAKGLASADLIIELIPTSKNITDISHSKWKSVFYYLSVSTVIVSFLTLIILLFINFKRKFIWMLIIIFVTILIQYNYLSRNTSIHALRPSIFVFFEFAFEPTWYRCNLPIGLIAFWIYYFNSKRINQAK